eukprot:TRINITY_DN37526_c0_g1_i1.p1 TRINITY_DN37526_c0_g1~~TRINITY_DN37526_c0_g1_i1.p1  ORF type:complete len:237 (-),score=47.80 TRINITY_DN37526_c0_g1_i1:176-886(-)
MLSSFVQRDSIQPDVMNLNPAELLTASMLVASIKSPSTYSDKDDTRASRNRHHQKHLNTWAGHDLHRAGWDGYDLDSDVGWGVLNETTAGNRTDSTTATTTTTTTNVPAWILERTEFIHHATDSRTGNDDTLLTKIFDLMTAPATWMLTAEDRVPEPHSPESASWFLDTLQEQDVLESEDEEARVRSLALQWSAQVWRQLTRTRFRHPQQQCPLRRMLTTSSFHPSLIQHLPISVY